MLPMGGVASTSKTASDKPCTGEGCGEVPAATLWQTRQALAQSRARRRQIQLKRKPVSAIGFTLGARADLQGLPYPPVGGGYTAKSKGTHQILRSKPAPRLGR